VHIIDPLTLQVREMNAGQFFKTPFRAVGNSRQFTNYVVLDITLLGPRHGKFALADVQVAKEADLGYNDTQYLGRTHLGNYLKPGDNVLGYDVANFNFNDEGIDELVRLSKKQLPDLILVKKYFPNRRKKQKPRHWQLKNLDMEAADLKKQERNKKDNDYEKFLQELEEDPELRSQIDLYKVPNAEQVLTEAQESMMEDEGEEEEEDFPEIKLEELMEDLKITDDQEDEEGEEDEEEE